MGRVTERVFRLSMAASVLELAFMGTFGCGSQTEKKSGVEGAAKLLKEEDLYKIEGTGKNQRKVPVDTNERLRLLREAGKKIEAH